jgi:hypothetical protein
MVTSVLRDGSMQSHNDGVVSGIPARFMGPLDLQDIIRKHFRAASGKGITLVQSAAVGPAGGFIVPQPDGPVRSFRYSVPGCTATVATETTVTLQPSAGIVELRKNENVSIAFQAVVYRRGSSPASAVRFLVPNIPTIDGAQPRSWDYLMETSRTADGDILTIRPNSIAFRSKNHPTPLPLLGSTEELTMAAPQPELKLVIPEGETEAHGIIHAHFMLRDFPEIQSEQHTAMLAEWKRNTSRNDPCPCGSGKKFKKCCSLLS